VKDILIACTDNLTGFSEAILASFPESEIQSCIIHQIRNSLKYVASKDQKTFMQDLKTVYQAPTKDKAELELDTLNDKWGSKYPVVIKSWQNNCISYQPILLMMSRLEDLYILQMRWKAFTGKSGRLRKLRALSPTIWLYSN